MWATVLLIMTKFQDVSLIAKRSKDNSRSYKNAKSRTSSYTRCPKKVTFRKPVIS